MLRASERKRKREDEPRVTAASSRRGQVAAGEAMDDDIDEEPQLPAPLKPRPLRGTSG